MELLLGVAGIVLATSFSDLSVSKISGVDRKKSSQRHPVISGNDEE
jgi:hypothetical protein